MLLLHRLHTPRKQPCQGQCYCSTPSKNSDGGGNYDPNSTYEIKSPSSPARHVSARINRIDRIIVGIHVPIGQVEIPLLGLAPSEGIVVARAEYVWVAPSK